MSATTPTSGPTPTSGTPGTPGTSGTPAADLPDVTAPPSAWQRLAAVVGADLVVLRRRGLLLGTYAAVTIVTAAITLLTFATAGDDESLPPGPGAQGTTVEDLEASTGMLAGLTSAVGILGVIAVCVAAAHVAGMFATGTVRNALVRSPGRATLVAGKVVAVSVFLLGAVVVAAASGIIAAYVAAPLGEVDTTSWSAAPGDVLAGVGQVALAVVGYGVVGAALGLAVRTPIPAVAIAIGWLLPIETILVGTVDSADRWLPGQLLSAVAEGGNDAVGLGAALVTVGGYLAVALAASTARFVRGDVTS